MKRMKKLEARNPHKPWSTAPQETGEVRCGRIISTEQKLRANGEPYLRLHLATWKGVHYLGQRPDKLTCNKFVPFDSNVPFEQKVAVVADYAEQFVEGDSCYCTIGSFTGVDGLSHLCVTDVYKR